MKTNTKIKSFMLALFFSLLCCTGAKAQVTIGLGEEPSRAALLELKTQQPNGENVTSDKGGLVLSRVKLVSKITLEPFIPKNDPDWINAATSKVKELHEGLMVYNLNAAAPFAEGLYVWNGLEWREYKAANDLVQTADNGLTLTNNRVQWGGELVNATTSIGVDASQRALQFNITNNTAGDDTKGLFVKGLKVEGSTQALTVTPAGKLGIASVIPARLAFFQSKSEQGNIATEVNTGNPVVVSFGQVDEITNNLVTFDDANDEFIIREDGILEISASVAYSPYSTAATAMGTSDICLLNATLQRKRAGTSTWANYSSVRNLWVGIAAYYRQTLNIPPILIDVYENDRLRLIIQRPPGSAAGHEHANASQTSDPTGIAPPFGTDYSKSIKILAIE
jgi:hypothetical protein